MKYLFLSFLFSAFLLENARAQTNTFPTSGPVGIGTISPATLFHVQMLSNNNSGNKAHFGTGEYGFTFYNSTNTGFYPRLSLNPQDDNDFGEVSSDILTANDIETFPALFISARQKTGSALVTRPVLGIRNYTTELMRVMANGFVGINTTKPFGRLDVSRNASASTSIDLSNSITVGATNVSISSKYLGQFGFVSADESFTTPKMVAFIGAEATEHYNADTNTGSIMRFYTGSNGGTNPVERMMIDNNGRVGIGTSAASHSLTFGSTGNGVAFYKTADQVTNYERIHHYWSGDTYTISSESAGTGTKRNISTIVNGTVLSVNNPGELNTVGCVDVSRTGGHFYLLSLAGEMNRSNYFQQGVSVYPTISQTGTAGYRGLFISPFENSVGTGQKYLIDAGTNSAAGGAGTHTSKFVVTNTGNVGIGTADTRGFKLAVAGNIISEAVIVKLQSAWPDYVFKPGYQLPSLTDVKAYIDKNQHLPEMPAEQEIAKTGQNLGEINKLLVKKVEELTLYLIDKDEKLKQLEDRLNKLEQKLTEK